LETPLKAITENTITDPEAFKRDLTLIRKRGFALDNEEITRGIMCIAAPVFGFKGDLVCSISIAFPAYIRDDRGIEPEIAAIKKYANLMSASLGRR